MEDITRNIASFVGRAQDRSVPADVLDVVRLSLFDWATVAWAGRDEPVARIVRAAEAQNGGAAQASTIGSDRRLPSRSAALINGTVGHALDYDDTHFAHIGHVSTVIMPAALAAAERSDWSGEEMLRAALAGAEASIRMGLWLGRSHYEAGFHQTSTAGTFGAALAAAGANHMDEDVLCRALALAASRASGLKAQFGTMAKPYHAGMAAAAGIDVLDLAVLGMEANPAALDGPFGFGATHAGQLDLSAFENEAWLFPEISHKLYACCHGTHAAIEALSELQNLGDIQSVEIAVHPRWLDVCNIAKPQTRLEAKFSLTLTGAMALKALPLTTDMAFEDSVIFQPDVVALRDRVHVVGDPVLTDTAARAKVTTAAGVQARTHDLAKPASLDARVTKVRAKSAALIGEAASNRLWEAINATGGPDIPALMTALRGA